MKKYDFIIAGGGMAGLSLAYYLTQSSLRDRSVLIVDRDQKDQNDRTWCFWERGTGPFESVLFKTWNEANFHGTTYAGPLGMGPYTYKMLRGIDFYDFVKAELAKYPNIEQKQASVERIKDTPQGGFVIADEEPYIADYVFDSTFALKPEQVRKSQLTPAFQRLVYYDGKTLLRPRPARNYGFQD